MTDIVNLSEVRMARTTDTDTDGVTYEITDLPGVEADSRDGAAAPVDLAKDLAKHDPAGGVGVVDGGPRLAAVKTSRRDRPHVPIIPPWMRDPAAAKAAAQWAVRYYTHCAAFHAVRLPVYWARLAARSPIGIARITHRTVWWMFDLEHRELRAGLALKASDPHSFLRLQEQRTNTIRSRAAVVLLAALAVAVVVAAVAMAGPVAKVLAVATTLAGLGAVGRDRGARLTGRATDNYAVPKLTADLIINALNVLGLSSISGAIRQQGATAVGFPGPITRDGPGWRADIDLPGGATAGEVIDRRSKLASGLRRPLGCVWPEAAPEVHEGRLVLWVGDQAMSEAKPKPWPLAKTGKVNLFEPIVIGYDQRGRPITVTLMFVAVLIGAIPRQGKTFVLRLLLLAASLDVRVELHVYDLKGGADLLPLQHVAHAFRIGDEPEDIDYLVRDLRAVHAEMRRRYKVIRGLDKDVCPESKVTDALASNKSVGLHPIVIALDECGLAFTHPEHGKEIIEKAVDIVKRGPAAGIILILATQRIDAASVPPGISANAALRLALKVMDHTANDMILGTGMYKAGVRATMFARSDKGVALVVGEGDHPDLVQASYVDSPTAEVIALRSRAARAAANRLTGLAAGAEVEPEVAETILDHLLAIWPTGDGSGTGAGGSPDAKVWCDDLAQLLAAAYPGTYDGWEGVQVTSAVAPHGLSTLQVKRTIDGRAVNRRGLAHADVRAAHTSPDSTDDNEGGPTTRQSPPRPRDLSSSPSGAATW